MWENVESDTFLYINKEKATNLDTESSTSWLEQLKSYDFDTIVRKTRANVNTKFSERGIIGEMLSEDEYKKNCNELIEMNSVAQLVGNELDGDLSLKNKISNLFSQWGNRVYTSKFGNVELSNSSIRSDIRHGSTKEKITAYAAIPQVLENGTIIDIYKKNYGEVTRAVIAAPINIGDVPYIMGVMIQRDKTNQRLYLHDIVIKKEASKYQPDHLNTTGPLDNENLFMTEVLEKAISIGYSISQNKPKNNIKFSDTIILHPEHNDNRYSKRNNTITIPEMFTDEIDSSYLRITDDPGEKANGVLFKKAFDDGMMQTFEIVSNGKRTLNLQTIYMEKGDYKKMKSAETLLMDAPSADVLDEDRSNFTNSIPASNENVNTKFSERNINKYTQKEYNDYGWASANGLINAGQNADYRSKFAMAKTGRAKFNKSKNGEYIIPVSDIYDSLSEGINTVLVFAKGTIDNPKITRIIIIDLYDETELDIERRKIYELERRGIQQKVSELFRQYNSVDFRIQHTRYDNESGRNSYYDRLGRRSGGETTKTQGQNISSLKSSADEKYSLRENVLYTKKDAQTITIPEMFTDEIDSSYLRITDDPGEKATNTFTRCTALSPSISRGEGVTANIQQNSGRQTAAALILIKL